MNQDKTPEQLQQEACDKINIESEGLAALAVHVAPVPAPDNTGAYIVGGLIGLGIGVMV